MNTYAESSAVLAWLLGESPGKAVASVLSTAEIVVASDLTLVECDRVLHRATFTGDLTEADAAARRATLNLAAAHWVFVRLDEEIIERARLPFPAEPIRTLDAIHLSTALAIRGVIPDLHLITLDGRVRENGLALGFEVLPA